MESNFSIFARFFLLKLRFFFTQFCRPYLHGRVEPDVHFWCVGTSTSGISRLPSVDAVLASIEHSKLFKSLILCFVVLWPDASVRRRSISFNTALQAVQIDDFVFRGDVAGC